MHVFWGLCLLFLLTSGCPRCGALPGDASWWALAVGTGSGEINVFFGCGPDVEGGDVDELVANADVALTDEDTGVVDGLGESLLVHLGLKTTFQKLLGGQLKDEIELELIIRQQAVATHTSQQSGSLKDAFGILRVQSEQRTSGFSQLCKSVLHSPDFTLASQSVLSDELELGVETFLLVRTTRGFESLAVCDESDENMCQRRDSFVRTESESRGRCLLSSRRQRPISIGRQSHSRQLPDTHI